MDDMEKRAIIKISDRGRFYVFIENEKGKIIKKCTFYGCVGAKAYCLENGIKWEEVKIR